MQTQTPVTASFVSAPVPRVRQRITTRLAIVDDVELLQKIVSEAYSTDKNWSNQSAYIVDERVTVEELRETIKRGEDTIVVAEVDGELAGCVKVEFSEHHPELQLPATTALLGMLAVRPEFEIFVLNKRADLQRMYARKAGFRRTGETQPFTYGGRVLQSDVHFVVFECDLIKPMAASRL